MATTNAEIADRMSNYAMPWLVIRADGAGSPTWCKDKATARAIAGKRSVQSPGLKFMFCEVRGYAYVIEPTTYIPVSKRFSGYP